MVWQAVHAPQRILTSISYVSYMIGCSICIYQWCLKQPVVFAHTDPSKKTNSTHMYRNYYKMFSYCSSQFDRHIPLFQQLDLCVGRPCLLLKTQRVALLKVNRCKTCSVIFDSVEYDTRQFACGTNIPCTIGCLFQLFILVFEKLTICREIKVHTKHFGQMTVVLCDGCQDSQTFVLYTCVRSWRQVSVCRCTCLTFEFKFYLVLTCVSYIYIYTCQIVFVAKLQQKNQRTTTTETKCRPFCNILSFCFEWKAKHFV